MSIKPFGIIRPCTKHRHLSPYNSAGVVGNLRLEGVAGGIPPKVGGGDVRIIVELDKKKG